MALVRANPNFKSIAREELTPDELTVLVGSFDHLANISLVPEGLDALILMSTCHSQLTTYNACAFAIEQWIRGRQSFDILLADLRQVRPDELVATAAVRGATLFPDADPTSALRAFLAGLNPGVEKCLGQSLLCLSEYRHKHDIFYKRFAQLQKVAQVCCESKPPGRLFWRLQVEGKQLLNPARDPDTDRRFGYLGLASDLASHLTHYALAILWQLRVLRKLADAPGPPERPAAGYAASYNLALEAWANICGPTLTSVIPPELHAPSTAAWADWWDTFVDSMQQCYSEIREFFDKYVPRFSHNKLLPYLPNPGGKRTTILGSTEETWHNAFVLFFDIVRSKKSPAEVKDQFAQVLRTTDSLVCTQAKSADPSDDAFVVVTKSWPHCLEVARVCQSAAQALPQSDDGFGGIRMSLEVGAVTVVRSPDELAAAPRETDVHPIIAYAAYLVDAVKQRLPNPKEFTNCVMASSKAKEFLVAKQFMPATAFTEVGTVTGKDGYSTVAHRLHIFGPPQAGSV